MKYANLSRRSLLAIGTAAAAGVVVGASAPAVAAPARATGDPWARLVAGNARFAAGRQAHPRQDPAYRRSLVAGQEPFACVVGCADSRAPAELLFDQGLGDLFTVRAIGEMLDDGVVGSIEYAVEHLHVPLVVVLGHAECGAVKAAIDLVRGTSEVTGSVSTVARAVEATVRATPPQPTEREFVAACVRNQALRVAEELPRRSPTIDTAVTEHGVHVVAAVYDLGSGLVRRH
ncbi:MAG: carbonic anhydrase [Actinophytocola sp.]|uniref:carbonic anhydrase n=1 Tax=Actinophytocola sp. TaxID=1872138 RepID=UPI00132BE146|nr:carbonic anhydrase [Actinophytocola sp.]MPZ80607.1 carbonic anhydrase [Actinophytocola sp.]